MKIAIVTGASSGLGMAFVRRLDALGGLDEIWGVARRGERLEALAAELRTPMRPLALDLTRLESVETLRVLMREEEPEVAVLVNAAGFGKFGTCADLTLQETCDMPHSLPPCSPTWGGEAGCWRSAPPPPFSPCPASMSTPPPRHFCSGTAAPCAGRRRRGASG